MTGTTTGQTALPTATDSDDNENYLTVSLVAALQALANLFESGTGHDHSGAGKGKPIPTAGIAAGATLTSPHFSSPVVDSGGLTITAGGLAVAASSATNDIASNIGPGNNILRIWDGSTTLWRFRSLGDLLPPLIATTSTDGFLYIGTVNNTPTGLPTNRGASASPVLYDSLHLKIMVYDAGTASWKGVAVS